MLLFVLGVSGNVFLRGVEKVQHCISGRQFALYLAFIVHGQTQSYTIPKGHI
jgi:hypothetical protein